MLTCCRVPRPLLLLLTESCAAAAAAGGFLGLVWLLHSCHGMPHVIRIGESPGEGAPGGGGGGGGGRRAPKVVSKGAAAGGGRPRWRGSPLGSCSCVGTSGDLCAGGFFFPVWGATRSGGRATRTGVLLVAWGGETLTPPPPSCSSAFPPRATKRWS